ENRLLRPRQAIFVRRHRSRNGDSWSAPPGDRTGGRLALDDPEETAAIHVERVADPANRVANRFDHLIGRQIDGLNREFRDESLELHFSIDREARGVLELLTFR